MFAFLAACAASGPGAPPADAAGGADSPAGPDAADVLYDPDVLHEVEVTIAPADWDALRFQDRSIYDFLGDDCMEGPWESPYTWFSATVRFDGEELGEVGVRKKGLLGSASTTRPSLRVDTDHYVDGARFHGLEKLVLNNNNQDPSRMRTCLAHEVFADAGLVAPRCSLAHVVVNGEDLGVYDNTEAIDEDLVARVRGAPPAAMYEGALSDFRDGWLQTFEAETDESDGSELAAVAAALAADDAAVLDRLDDVVDLDAFTTFWAAEGLTGHWDGYAGNTNNFYVYADPDDGRLRFVASGPDATFDSREPFGAGQPIWVASLGALANRLLALPDARAAYEAELQRLLDEAWRADERLARIDAWKDLVRGVTSRDERRAVADLREVVAARADDVAAHLGERVTPVALRGDPCWVPIGAVRVDFSTTWGSYPEGDLYAGGDATVSYVIDGVDYPSTQDGVSIGAADDVSTLWLTISEVAPDVWLAPYVVFDTALLGDDVDLPVDGHPTEAYLLLNSADTGGEWATAAYLGDGVLHFERASTLAGADVVGWFDAAVLGSEG